MPSNLWIQNCTELREKLTNGVKMNALCKRLHDWTRKNNTSYKNNKLNKPQRALWLELVPLLPVKYATTTDNVVDINLENNETNPATVPTLANETNEAYDFDEGDLDDLPFDIFEDLDNIIYGHAKSTQELHEEIRQQETIIEKLEFSNLEQQLGTLRTNIDDIAARLCDNLKK